jgi:hypothetical protein
VWIHLLVHLITRWNCTYLAIFPAKWQKENPTAREKLHLCPNHYCSESNGNPHPVCLDGGGVVDALDDGKRAVVLEALGEARPRIQQQHVARLEGHVADVRREAMTLG